MDTAFVISFIGTDRPGLVEKISTVVDRNDGNWLDARLSQLGGKFAGLVLVRLDREKAADLERELDALDLEGISVRLTPADHDAPRGSGRRINLEILGPDRHGIVREVATALNAQQINVLDMDSRVVVAPMSAEQLFQAHVLAEVPEDYDSDQLATRLDSIAEAMTLEIDVLDEA